MSIRAPDEQAIKEWSESKDALQTSVGDTEVIRKQFMTSAALALAAGLAVMPPTKARAVTSKRPTAVLTPKAKAKAKRRRKNKLARQARRAGHGQ